MHPLAELWSQVNALATRGKGTPALICALLILHAIVWFQTIPLWHLAARGVLVPIILNQLDNGRLVSVLIQVKSHAVLPAHAYIIIVVKDKIWRLALVSGLPGDRIVLLPGYGGFIFIN
jgi:hypothetical protein